MQYDYKRWLTVSYILQTLLEAYDEGALQASYVRKWLDGISTDLKTLEKDAAPDGWKCLWNRYAAIFIPNHEINLVNLIQKIYRLVTDNAVFDNKLMLVIIEKITHKKKWKKIYQISSFLFFTKKTIFS